MGKPTGFLDYERESSLTIEPLERIQNFNEFHIPLDEEQQERQASRCMDCGTPFCQAGVMMHGAAFGCPLNNLVPEWNDLLYHKNWELAYDRLQKTNMFPEFTSRVCPALCEAACTCNINGDPVSSKENEHAIIEKAYEEGWVKREASPVKTGKKIAVVGSGPSGLAAALQLVRRGHKVTVFEREDRPGGLLMYGIPNMKLDKSVIARRVELMRQEGVEFIFNCNVGVDYEAEQMIKDFNYVVLACGAANPRNIMAPGRDAEGIYFAVDYLKGVTKSLLNSNLKDKTFVPTKGKNVVVIGGGDTGNDCVGTAIRLGAKSVIQLEMMPKPPICRAANNPWPEWPRTLKVDYGQQEAIAVFGSDPRLYQTTVKEFVKGEDGKLKKLICVKLQPKQDEKSGRTIMVPVEGSEFEMDADIVLIAAGFLGSEKAVTDAFGVEVDGRSNVKTKPGHYHTSRSKVYVTGDMHRGQSLVVWAIREGREAAKAIDLHMMGYTNLI